jgi:hypothetical protein
MIAGWITVSVADGVSFIASFLSDHLNDISEACEYLGKEGCLIPFGKRPELCHTYFCEKIPEYQVQKEREILENAEQDNTFI